MTLKFQPGKACVLSIIIAFVGTALMVKARTDGYAGFAGRLVAGAKNSEAHRSAKISPARFYHH
ncbi:MAG: hypothetical protein WDM76_16235 [Limisphaerales bacterium]